MENNQNQLTEAQQKARLLVRVAHAVKKIRQEPEPFIPLHIRQAAAKSAGIFITKRFKD